ncbi:MAG TPA: redox-sensing transcriptional repressor Rex [Bryobacteraceae bacterium]|nr:redox-sensing transcriptional repressor Rex [Bryobacteraceae bacterium]
MKPPHHDVPEATLRRLPIYYRWLQDVKAAAVVHAVSCADLARGLGLDATLVRKDIEMTGIVGKPRVGYPLEDLVRWIENFLGLNRPKSAVLAGTGSLGSALMGYGKFRTHGMQIVAAFDIDPEKIGQMVHGLEVRPLFCLPDFVRHTGTPMGLIATPGGAAQSVADLMVTGGIRAIWNFAPAHIRVPRGIILQNEDLYYSLASLSYKLEHLMTVEPAESDLYVQNN